MNTDPAPSLVDYQAPWLAELVAMWRASFEAGVGVIDPHPVAEQRQYFLDQVLSNNVVRLAIRDGQLLGFVAASSESVAQLYVRLGCHRRGIGTQMLEWAKAQSGGSLWLYTFERNQVACKFYERNGFTVAARGFETMWQLDDVKYRWSGAAQRRRT